jgi:hypothetical protein
MEDAKELSIQETRQEKRPARMVGSASLDSEVRNGMEAGRSQKFVMRQREEE